VVIGTGAAASICGFLTGEPRELVRTTGFTAVGLTAFLVVLALGLLAFDLDGFAFPAIFLRCNENYSMPVLLTIVYYRNSLLP
jgi:hypothetical protein